MQKLTSENIVNTHTHAHNHTHTIAHADKVIVGINGHNLICRSEHTEKS